MAHWQTSPLYIKSRALALAGLKFSGHIRTEFRSYILADQLARSAMSVGANTVEASEAESAKDMLHKLAVALKEARETEYFLSLALEYHEISNPDSDEFLSLTNEVIAMLVTSKNTLRRKIEKSKTREIEK